MRITNFHPHRFPPLLKRALAAILCVAFLMPNAAFACAWDRDTMAAEADGRMDTLNAIVGNFDIYPAQYYEMRIERVAKELAADPTKLELYDDIAVASDRVGRSTDAIEWMARKREQLDKLTTPNAEAEYRYLANLGTFHAHRWVGSGANRDDLTDLELGRDLIAAAIELNPDAHFGREKYQLMAIEWLIDPPPFGTWRPESNEPEWEGNLPPPVVAIPGYLGNYPLVERSRLSDQLAVSEARGRFDYEAATQGMVGLVSLGAGAKSVDIMHTIRALLENEDHASLSYIARLRTDELYAAGGRSLHPGADGSRMPFPSEGHFGIGDASQANLEAWFASARRVADANQDARRTYLLAMMTRGEHPDTHPKVWKRAPKRSALPELPGTRSLWNRLVSADGDLNARMQLGLLFILFFGVGLLVSVSGLKSFRRSQLAGAATQPDGGPPEKPH